MSEPLLSVRGLVKQYHALRPLRVQALEVMPAACVSLTGLDADAAEMFAGILTGAVLPDEGEVRLFGRSTREVTDSDAWLAMLDDVGIVTDRAVLVAQFTVEQNLAIPFTLQVDPVAEAMRSRVAALAGEVGLTGAHLNIRVADAPLDIVARVRLGRALALDPKLVIAEHPSATLPRETVKGYANDLARVARSRQLAVLAMTADEQFASALGGQVLTLSPASGELKPRGLLARLMGYRGPGGG